MDRKRIPVFILILAILLMYIHAVYSAEISTNSFDPPKGNCKQGEVYRCTQGTCFSTLLYCPPVYEDGKLIYSTNCNTTKCNWNCECVEKKDTENIFQDQETFILLTQ